MDEHFGCVPNCQCECTYALKILILSVSVWKKCSALWFLIFHTQMGKKLSVQLWTLLTLNRRHIGYIDEGMELTEQWLTFN